MTDEEERKVQMTPGQFVVIARAPDHTGCRACGWTGKNLDALTLHTNRKCPKEDYSGRACATCMNVGPKTHTPEQAARMGIQRDNCRKCKPAKFVPLPDPVQVVKRALAQLDEKRTEGENVTLDEAAEHVTFAMRHAIGFIQERRLM